MSKYNSISIKKAMEKIASNNYVLPAIQRKFVWRPEQIEMLFDSILRNYPINSFMFWEISDSKLKLNYKFYSFIKDYADRYNENNPDAPSRLLNTPFIAVIDGQQRLTSLYIGLNGTYRYKKPNKWWSNDEEAMPTRRLYLNVTRPVDSKIDNEKMYDFRFLSEDDLEDLEKYSSDKRFKVSKVIDFRDLGDVNDYLIKNNLQDNNFAMKTLSKLMQKINTEELISFYTEQEQDQDKVLDVFIRTNSGGTTLSFSDLLMSIASANWARLDARDEIRSIREEIRQYGSPNFNVSQDFILKSLLVLSDVDVRFKIANFGRDNIAIFENNWKRIRSSLVASFRLLANLGFNDTLIRAKNAVIPIAYYILNNDLAEEVVKSTYSKEDINRISTWLTLSLLKGIFGGHSDSVLRTLRDVIKKSSNKEYFPLKEIILAFKNSPDKNYSLDDEIIEGFLKEQYQSSMASLVLYLLYPNTLMKCGNNIAQDHMHCKTNFNDDAKFNAIHFSPDDVDFCKNPENWNSVLNLQLLPELDNKSKSSMPLKAWADNTKITKKEMYLDEDTSLEIIEFRKFIESRKKNIIKKIKDIVSI